MEFVLEVLKLLVPAGIVFATAYFLIKKYLDHEAEKNQVTVKNNNAQIVTPLRLQAYERIILFLERISPNSLVIRTYKSGMSSRLLHSELLKAIRSEYEHNLSQQIYISVNGWEMLKNAKEEITKLINLSAAKVGEESTGGELSQFIIEASAKIQKMPTQMAIDYLKKEIAQNF